MQFPPHLDERWCRRDRPSARDTGECVLYWMRTAVRGHENPALDAALWTAQRLDLPLLVYHAVSERYPYANDRHHTFILEGARDVCAELGKRGIPYVLHVEREGHRGPHLKTLGARAAVVITEEMPVSPLREWTERLAGAIESPVWTFDTACVVPVTLPGKPFTRAFKYRDAVKRFRAERLEREWEEQPDPEGMKPISDLPFVPVDIESVAISELVAHCRIDHAVAPVPHTRGGSTEGYARWEGFKARGIRGYGRTRNDPLRDGVSRMSAYLHYGHVSPMRLARESKALKADKYLDELVTWRELAYTYCYYESDLDTADALPSWARETLKAAERDPRPALLSWESLARAQTGDALWDACQRSLLVHGELHNNVRMTWGKAFLKWTPNVSRALELCLDLNHRYALDGRDPSSYGGILWCFGQLDRPFSPAQPILGVVRPRPTEQHAKRLDVRAYAAKTGRPLIHKPPRVAIVGAGMAGMSCARTLADHGVPVTVFDKGRGPGGRMSTRRAEPHVFDHGAQYFVARDPHFRRYVLSWLEDEIVARWEGTPAFWENGEVRLDEGRKERFVGTPSMSAVVAHLGRDLDTRFGQAVESVTGDKVWDLTVDNESHGPFDAVLFGAPAPQTKTLAPHFEPKLSSVTYRPGWTSLISLGQGYEAPEWDSLRVVGSPVAWIARNTEKPGRVGDPAWVVQASSEWSQTHLEDDKEAVAAALLNEVKNLTGLEESHIVDNRAHRWRYGLVDSPLGEPCLWDPETRTGVCGDGCLGPRVEDAFLSGVALAGRVLGWMRGE